MLARTVASWLSLLAGLLLLAWSLYTWVFAPLLGDSRGSDSGPPPGPSLMDDVFTFDNVVLLAAGLFFSALQVWASYGMRRSEAGARQAWSVVALAVAVPVIFWLFFVGGLLSLLAGIIGVLDARAA